MELVAYAANIMANWAFELPAAAIAFTGEQKEMLKNSLMQMAEMFVSTGLHEAALLGACAGARCLLNAYAQERVAV